MRETREGGLELKKFIYGKQPRDSYFTVLVFDISGSIIDFNKVQPESLERLFRYSVHLRSLFQVIFIFIFHRKELKFCTAQLTSVSDADPHPARVQVLLFSIFIYDSGMFPVLFYSFPCYNEYSFF